MTYPKGTKVKITLEGIVSNPSSVPARFMYVKPLPGDKAQWGDFHEVVRIDLHSNVTIEEIVPEFNPQPGEIYTITPEGSVHSSTWFVTMDLGDIKMVSQAGVFSLALFKDAYIRESGYRLTKAEIKQEEKWQN